MADFIQGIKRDGIRQQVIASTSNRREAIDHFPGYDHLATDDRQVVQRIQSGEQRSALLYANNNFHLLEHEADGYVVWSVDASELCEAESAPGRPCRPSRSSMLSAWGVCAAVAAVTVAIWCSVAFARLTTLLADNSRQLEQTAQCIADDRELVRAHHEAMLNELGVCRTELRDESASRRLFSDYLGKLVEVMQQKPF